jgi:dTDP-4-dehydrorhamnose reductase
VATILRSNFDLKPRYLVFGASGFLGSRIFEVLSGSYDTFGTFHNARMPQSDKMRKVNLSKEEEMLSVIQKIKPSHIINCTGLTNVEKCELLPEASWKLNSEIPFRLAKFSANLNIRFIHISTDHFGSPKSTPRSELDPSYGINQYGFTKIMAEKLVLSGNSQSLVLRTNFFGLKNGKSESLLNFAMSRIQNGIQIDGFDDVIFSPVGIAQICRFLTTQNIANATGILNFASDEPISKYDFMRLVAKAMGRPEADISRSSIESSNLTVKRPNYLALNPTRLHQELDFALPGIEEMIDEEINRAV